MCRRSALLLGLCASVFLHAPDALAQPPDILKQQAVLKLPGMESVQIDSGIVFEEIAGRSLKMDLFHPLKSGGTAKSKGKTATRFPVVIFVNGVGIDDPPLRRWGIYQSWGRLVAVSGMAAVTHDSRRDAPREDLEALVAHLKRNADRYRIDPDNIGIWACSANLIHGSRYALNPANTHVKAAVFYYGGIDTTNLRTDLPILVGRGGLDNAGTNAGMDGWVWRALRRNATVTSINVPNGRHAFDLFDDVEPSRDAIRSTLAFLRANLSTEMQEGRRANATQRLAIDRHAARDWEGTIAAATEWIQKEPDQAQPRQLLGDAHYNLRHYREAAESYERAGDAGYYPALTSYNAACAWALVGERERALRNLEKAYATGFITNRSMAANDPDLVSLRDDPRFQRLVAGTR